jgi:Cytochrome P460
MGSKNKLAIVVAVLAVFAAVAGSEARSASGAGEDKYLLKTTSGIAFSDFKGYEDWSVISSARTDEVLKVIVGNPTMIHAYKAGVPLNGQAFPDGSRAVKLQWSPKKSTEAQFAVDVPDVFKQAFVMEKDSKTLRRRADGGMRCSIMMRRRISTRLIPHRRIAGTLATRR